MSYKLVDALETYQIEPGDLIKNDEHEIVQVFKVNHFDTYSEVIYLDEFLDEELSFRIDDSYRTELYIFEEDE